MKRYRTLFLSFAVALAYSGSVAAQALPTAVELAPTTPGSILFGTYVMVSGGIALGGATFETTSGGSAAGAAYVYARSGNGWSAPQRLTASDGAANDFFGGWAELSNDKLVVSAFGHGPAAGPKPGAVYIFTRSGSSWTQSGKLVPPVVVAGASYGQRMAMNDQFLLINGREPSSQRIVHVLEPSGSSFAQTGTLTPVGGGDFASHIALWQRTAVVGAAGATNAGGVATGAAYVFDRVGSAFAQTIKLNPGDGAASDSFGFSVAIWGDRIVVGAYLDDEGAQTDRGAAFVFEKGVGGWSQVAKLQAPDGVGGDHFGKDVRICGDRILIGAPQRDEGGNANQGAIYRFDRVGTTWTFGEKRTLPAPGLSNAYFGDHLAVDAQHAVVGAPFMNRAFGFVGGCNVQDVHRNGFE